MRVYLEVNETVAFDPEFIRADVTGKTVQEITVIQADIDEIMAGKSYKIWKHDCHHDEGGSCPERELVKEVLI